jgi:N-acylneuraminate cytidylyltransferase
VKKTSVLAIVPARGGSQGLARKNLREVGGVSLVGRAVRVATEAGLAEVVVSSDDAETLEEARRVGAVPVRRAKELAEDDSSLVDVVLSCCTSPGHEVVVLLQPTSPLRSVEDVSRCLDAVNRSPSVATVCPTDHPWQWTLEVGPSGKASPVAGWTHLSKRRQDLAPGYRVNGAVYVARVDWLRQFRAFIGLETEFVHMPRERSVDIDDHIDLRVAESLWRQVHS